MNEIEYMLRRDAREKKAAGRGIYHKRSGSKTHYVGLPSDHMTAAEKKRRNSPVFTYNISKRLTYDEFKALPTDLEQEYIDKLQLTYNVPADMIAESLGTTVTALRAWAHKHNLSFRRREKLTYDELWVDFLGGKYTSNGARVPVPEELAVATEDTKPVVEEPKPAPVIETTPKPANTKAILKNIDLRGHGTPDALLDMLMTAFADLTDPAQTYEFAIRLGVKGGED